MKKIVGVSLLALILGFAPADDFIASLSKKLEVYNSQVPALQLHLIFNQEKYSPADTVFFSSYVLNENFQPIRERKILTLEMSGPDGKILSRINFRIAEGKSYNQLVIPADAEPGFYRFSVFPSMSSDFSRLLFSKELPIVLKNKIEPSSGGIKIFPEGGRLVAGVENHIVIKALGAGGGVIKDNNQNAVASFTMKNGYGEVVFTPGAGNYFAELNGVKSESIATTSEACALRVSQEQSDCTLTIKAPGSFNDSKKNIYLVVTSRRRITYSSKVNFDDALSFKITIPREGLPKGLSQAAVLDEDGNVLAQRLLFTSSVNSKVNLISEKKSLAQREKAVMEISITDKDGEPVEGDFSVSILKKDLEQGDSLAFPFATNMLLSGCPGLKADAKADGKMNSNPDLALIATSSALIDWREVQNAKGTKSSSSFSESLIRVKGRAVYRSSGKPVPDSTLIVGFLQKAMIGYEAYTTKDGQFDLPFLYDFYNDEELFYAMEYKGKELDQPYVIQLERNEHPIVSSTLSKQNQNIDAYGDFVSKKKIIDKSYGYFISAKENRASYNNLNAKIEDEVMGADFTVNVQDYVVFPTMEDLVKEVIPFLEFRKSKNDSTLRLRLNQGTSYVRAKSEPLFVIDGVLTKNKNFFMMVKPADIMKIKIVNNLNKLAQLGVIGKNGIVLMETKKGISDIVSAKSTTFKVTGLSQPKNFYMPDYSKGNASSRIPDLRSNLFWAPFVKVDANGKGLFRFYASDDIGTYVVKVRGVTKSGEPFEAEKEIDVTFNR